MKKLVLICAPITSRSGYGNHARDIFKALYSLDKYDIKVMDVPWGSCPRNALSGKDDSGMAAVMKNAILVQGPNGLQMERQPDVYIDIRIPNEFQQVGKVNIGFTAGVETTLVSPAFLEGCNKMNCTIVTSEHSKSGFEKAIYDRFQQLPTGEQRKVGQNKLEKPLEVVFEGLEENKFFPKKASEISGKLNKTFENISESFCFLMVGQWCKGNYGEDRKDIPRGIKVFLETFANRPSPPALIVKTSGAGNSILDREECINKIKQVKNMFPADVKLPNIYLLHGSLTDDEMNDLYNHPKVKSFYLLSHGEGFGRPLLEASFTGLPIITSNWSGPIDFLDSEKTYLVGGSMTKVPKSVVWKDIIVEDSEWFVADEKQAATALNYVYTNFNKVKKNATDLMKINRDKFNFKKMAEKLDAVIEKYTKDIPKQVSLQLPKLKKVVDKKEEIKKPSIKLPKLKKVSV